MSKFETDQVVKEKLRKFKVIAETSDLTDKIIDKGLSSKFRDFEDALQYHCAIKKDCNILITSGKKETLELLKHNSNFAAYFCMTPDEYLKSLINRSLSADAPLTAQCLLKIMRFAIVSIILQRLRYP